MSSNRKGNIGALWGGVGLVLALVVIGFLNSMGASVLDGTAKTTCEAKGYVYNAQGCWSTYNATNLCTSTAAVGCVQYTTNYALNITTQSLEGQETIGTYQPTLATVGIFGLIIAVLMGAVAMFGGKGR